MLLYKYFAIKYKLHRPAGLLSLSLSSSANIAANREITKVMELEKEETMKNCSLAWPEHSLLRALSFSAYTESNNALHRREVWLVSCRQLLFLRTACLRRAKRVWSTGSRGWLCETEVWPHDTRRTHLKEVNTLSIPCCKDWISEVCYSTWNMVTLNHMKQMSLNWITW